MMETHGLSKFEVEEASSLRRTNGGVLIKDSAEHFSPKTLVPRCDFVPISILAANMLVRVA